MPPAAPSLLRGPALLPLLLPLLLPPLPLLRAAAQQPQAQQAQEPALFYRGEALGPDNNEAESEAVRQARQTQADLTVRTILEWLQGRSLQPGRKARDNAGAQSSPARQYLPAAEEEEEGPGSGPGADSGRPRPFQPNPAATAPPQHGSTGAPSAPGGSGGYPYQPSPQPPFPPAPPTASELPPESSPTPDTEGGAQLGQGRPRPSPPPGPNPSPATGSGGTVASAPDEENLHPPHIHNIEVQCAKDQMSIDIEFDRPFNGVIYSKGFYRQDACRYVAENSGETRYSFTVRLDSCGTQFVDQFREGGQAYLENVLVLQNEPGIQEVWDTVRRVRCLWEGNINKALSAELSVDMLSQEIVTFSGDTAVATLDIQMGRGPFAPKATGLVKIGETMTLVVAVEGDADFDVAVHDCVARDSSGANVVRLTDERGCVLRPKLMGAFQKTRDTGGSAASVLAYAFFQAFKFPDVMDLTMECNVELCKTDCQSCPDPDQSPEPLTSRRRRRREADLWSPAAPAAANASAPSAAAAEPVRVHRTLRVVSPDDIEQPHAATIINLGQSAGGVCMSTPGFMLAAGMLLAAVLATASLSACLWLRAGPAAARLAKA